jgi:hypothetical protein
MRIPKPAHIRLTARRHQVRRAHRDVSEPLSRPSRLVREDQARPLDRKRSISVEKLRTVEQEIAQEKGSLLLFALFLREDAPDVWDLLASAPWIEADKGAALRYLSEKLNAVLTVDELTTVSRIVIIDQSNPALAAMQSAVNIEHGTAEIRDSDFFGLRIQHAYVITSRRASP